MKTRLNGNTLLELMITLSIIGIIMAICLPIYSDYLLQTRRMEAASILTKLALAMEKYHTEHHTYQNATLAKLHYPERIVKNQYQLVIHATTDTDFVLMATPLDNQAKKDKWCAALILNSLDEKDITGTGRKEDCW